MMSLYGFIWDDFCSWYLEMIKPAYERPIDRQTYEATLDLYGDLMIALHPFLPFITEEIWHQLRERAPGDDCMMQAYPKGGQPDENLIYQVETAKEVIAKVRELRNQHQIKPREPLNVQVQNSASARSLYELKGLLPLIQKLAVLSDFSFTETEAPNSKSFIVGTEQYFVELNLEIDVVAERKKIEEELVYQAGFVKSIEGKLSNERFVAGAPQAVVDNERKKLADGLARIQILKEQLEKLG
jgi:valyl-tRNA synthetase